MKTSFNEMFIFGIIMVIFGFIVSYITDVIQNRPIEFWPPHALDMASGTFFTACLVYLLFAEKYINLKCNNILHKI